jgi:hypothetical protein
MDYWWIFSPEQIAAAVDQVFDHSERMLALRQRARKTIIDRYESKNDLFT